MTKVEAEQKLNAVLGPFFNTAMSSRLLSDEAVFCQRLLAALEALELMKFDPPADQQKQAEQPQPEPAPADANAE